MIRPIGRTTWYRITLFLPVILPSLIIIASIIIMPSFRMPDYAEVRHLYSQLFFLDNPLSVFFIYQLWLGGIPYLLFVCGVLFWGRGKTLAQLERASWLLPILFIPPCLCFTSFLLSEFSLGLVPVIFLFGYFYVLLAHGLTWLLTKGGVVHA